MTEQQTAGQETAAQETAGQETADQDTKRRTTRATRTAEARAARRARLEQRGATPRQRARLIPARPKKRERDPNFMVDPPREPGPHRPWSVTTAGLLAYILAALFLTRGVQNPSDSSGSGGNGIAFIIIGTVLLGLATFTLQGRPLARVCLIIPMVAGCVVVIHDNTQNWWLRSGSGVVTVVIIALLLLEPRARTFFGDDATPLQLTRTHGEDEL